MDAANIIKIVGIGASIVLPLFNIPLVLKIRKRGSSKDFSKTWAIGVWTCILLMTPSVYFSPDIVFKVFGVMNLVLFSVVVVYILKYR